MPRQTMNENEQRYASHKSYACRQQHQQHCIHEILFTSVHTTDRIFPYIRIPYRGVEQLVARRAHNPKVVGSSPAPATNKALVSLDARAFGIIGGPHSITRQHIPQPREQGRPHTMAHRTGAHIGAPLSQRSYGRPYVVARLSARLSPDYPPDYLPHYPPDYPPDYRPIICPIIRPIICPIIRPIICPIIARLSPHYPPQFDRIP